MMMASRERAVSEGVMATASGDVLQSKNKNGKHHEESSSEAAATKRRTSSSRAVTANEYDNEEEDETGIKTLSHHFCYDN